MDEFSVDQMNKLVFTFCLFLSFSALAQAEDSEFDSVHLEAFYQKAVTVSTVKLDGVEYCKLYHQGLSISESSKNQLVRYNVDSLNEVNEDDVKDILIQSEKNDPTFWEENNVVLNESKLNTLDEIISSNIFNNLSGVVDNIYCFPYLGSRYENDQDRKRVVTSLNGIKSEVKAYIYYDDGYYSKSASVLIVYLLDPEKNEVYALKGVIK